MIRRFSWVMVVSFFGALLVQAPVLANTNDTCLCYDEVTKINLANTKTVTDQDVNRTQCFAATSCDTVSITKQNGDRWGKCVLYTNSQLCIEAKDKWDSDLLAQLRDAEKAKTGSEAKSGLSAFIPSCAFETKLTAECKDVGIFIILLINICRYLFSIIGGVALLVFIYGGFLLILSQGKSEQIEQGKGAMTSAVIGLVVAFSGYLLIRTLSEVIGVGSEFRL